MCYNIIMEQKFSIENNKKEQLRSPEEITEQLEEVREERLGMASKILESIKEKALNKISSLKDLPEKTRVFIRDLPENTQKMIKGELEISTKSSLVQDNTIPVWDLVKMSIENFQGKTWDGHELDRKSYMIRWTTIAIRSVSLSLKVKMAMDLAGDNDELALSSALMFLFKGVGMGTYAADQLRHNYDAIKKKSPRVSKLIEKWKALSKWLEIQDDNISEQEKLATS